VGTSPASHQPAPSFRELNWRNLPNPIPVLCELIPRRVWKGWGLNWQNGQLRQGSREINRACTLQYGDQCSDLFKEVIC